MYPPFADRTEAGRLLAESLAQRPRADCVVLALPRGGVPVAVPVAQRVGAPLDVFVVRKLGVPGHEELAMGAVASGGARVLNDDVVQMLDIPPDVIERVAARELAEVERREIAYRDGYRDGRPPTPLRSRKVILIDDGLATGATMRAAIAAVSSFRPARIVVAVPVGSSETCAELAAGGHVSEVVCVAQPEPFMAVGYWYRDFRTVDDTQVRALMGLGAPERD
ncbi:MAG: phosphoribosyltransferase [Dehalococcoidia bacterium]|nr:phosphoribosyltransferase [Dehalococcoidia bacterium]